MYLKIFMDFIKKLYKNRSMIRSMAVRNLKQQYVGSVLGVLWSVVYPLFEVAIYWLVFGLIMARGKPDAFYGTESFLLFLICGLIPFQFFSGAVGQSTTSIVSNQNLVKKAVGFPTEILPIVTITTQLIDHFIGVGLIFLAVVLFKGGITIYVLSFLIYLFLITVFMIGLTWLTSSINIYVRDMGKVIALALRLLFFLTPIVYSVGMVPEGIIKTVYKLNPLYHFVEGYRYAFLVGEFMPVESFAYLAFISFLFLGIGGIIFRKLKPGFAEVL